MTDIQQLLDGTVETVKTRLSGLDGKTLAALLAAEQAGEDRKGVINAIERASAEAAARGVTYTSDTDRGDGAATTIVADVSAPAVAVTTAASLDRSGTADIAPATAFDPSGAPVQSSGFDLDHVSLDTNPRANTTADQNRIDFNDPVRPGHEIVEGRLNDAA